MQYLCLMRHASSKYDASNDFNRTLTTEGDKQADSIPDYFARHLELLPDLILCSTAQRTKLTIQPLLQKFEIKIHYLDELYCANYMTIQNIIAQYQTAKNLMIVSHNPGISKLVRELAEVAGDQIEPEMQYLQPSQMAIFQIIQNSATRYKELVSFYESI
jgi:phosphohistidine phosphatase